MFKKNYPVILQLKEKHDDTLYIANNAEELYAIFAAIVRERADTGYYYQTVEQVERDIRSEERDLKSKILGKYESLTDKEVASLPESLATEYNELFAKYEKSVKVKRSNYDNELQDAKFIQQIVESDAPHKLTYTSPRGREWNLAEYIMYARSDAEYEGYELISPQVAPSIESFKK